MSATETNRSPTQRRGSQSSKGREGQLTVAVTGATGTVGPALLARLERSESVGRIRVLSRRRSAEMPASVDFRRVDVRDHEAVQRAVAGADVVVHMAYALYGVKPGEDELFATNVRGTLNVARAAAATGARRLVYLSSAAVYGLRSDNPQPLTEENEIRASARHFYSRHKAQSELLVGEALRGTGTDAYLLRPCGIVGPHAAGGIVSALPDSVQARLSAALRTLAAVGLRPALPAPPVPLQFVHEDDVAQAVELAVLGHGSPGAYNLAGRDVVGGHEALELLGIRPLSLPRVLVEGALRAVSAAPLVVPAVSWPELVTEPILIDSAKAYRELGWTPGYDSRAALRDTRAALGW